MITEDIKASLEQLLGGKIKEMTLGLRRIFVLIPAEDLVQTVRHLKEKFGITYLSTISARDTGTEIHVIYHLSVPGVVVSVKVAADRQKPVIPSLLEVIPGAVFYEREIHDILGVVCDGHPDLRPLVLPDDWPAGVYPLRKDWQYNRETEIIQ